MKFWWPLFLAMKFTFLFLNLANIPKKTKHFFSASLIWFYNKKDYPVRCNTLELIIFFFWYGSLKIFSFSLNMVLKKKKDYPARCRTTVKLTSSTMEVTWCTWVFFFLFQQYQFKTKTKNFGCIIPTMDPPHSDLRKKLR